MELTMKNGFCEMNEMEMLEVDGGGAFALVGTVTACLALGKLAFECGEKIGQTAYVLFN